VQELVNLLPFIVALLAFYFLLIRPARNRQREQLRLHESLAPGQTVMTTSGLVATLVAVEDTEVLLEAAPGVVLRWAKAAVGRVLPAADEQELADGAETPSVPD